VQRLHTLLKKAFAVRLNRPKSPEATAVMPTNPNAVVGAPFFDSDPGEDQDSCRLTPRGV
jgi:hypothetical protein